MSYYSELSIDTRTCGQADEDAYLDRRDGYRAMTRARVFDGLAAERWLAAQAARAVEDVEQAVRESTLERAAELFQAGYYAESRRLIASEFEGGAR